MGLFFDFLFMVVMISFGYGALSGAPWVPSWGFDVQRAIRLATIKHGDTFVDLGCGDGRLVAAAAREGAHAIGYEVALVPYAIAKLRQWFFRGAGSMDIRLASFWNASLRDVDIVYIFLMKQHYPRLMEKLKTELKPGARVVTYVWPLPGWTIAKKEPVVHRQPPLFFYTID